ncbi:PepSY-associated TM helix domain-containing protein [Aquisalimonas sp.]|uniref:PepSY-associated TM helix domain-containing protein n=1 Tax=Aquisalimonas sp. TaxID=1872621 RepID=UPI0025C57969|nr:PepSY-associated TM helix domain-containing protein [Aquisalimonas sp.]
MAFKRQIYLWHRYLGIALCLLIAMWFASGIVLMYVGYPSLDDEARLAGLPTLEADAGLAPPAAVMERYGDVDALRLNAAPGRPAYHFRQGGEWQSVDAATGEPLTLDAMELAGAARRHAGAEAVALEPVEVDQWTVSGRFNAHRPLVRARMEDDAGSWLYLSSSTGEVVQATTRFERGWNWVGAVVHWIYPWQLRQHPELWRQVVIWLSVPAIALILSGTVVGFWRLRVRRRYKGGRMTPYQGWHRWHHILGIACVVFVFTFMLSGLLSMNPGRVFTPPAPDAGQTDAWADGPLITEAAVSPAALLAAAPYGVRELEWDRQAGAALVHLHGADTSHVRQADGSPFEPDADTLIARAEELVNEGSITEATRLTDYDHYYYARRNDRPLPVLRLRYDDAAGTTLYINPETATIESRIDHSGRWRRWLYNGLHSLDFPVLWERRPLWDVVVLGLSLAGLAFSLTGAVIGWKRLVGRVRVKRRH